MEMFIDLTKTQYCSCKSHMIIGLVVAICFDKGFLLISRMTQKRHNLSSEYSKTTTSHSVW